MSIQFVNIILLSAFFLIASGQTIYAQDTPRQPSPPDDSISNPDDFERDDSEPTPIEVFGSVYYPEENVFASGPSVPEGGIYKRNYWNVESEREFTHHYMEFINLRQDFTYAIAGLNPGYEGGFLGILNDPELAKDRRFTSKFNVAVVAAGHLRLEKCTESLMDHVMYTVTDEGLPTSGMNTFMYYSAAHSLSQIGGPKMINDVLNRIYNGEEISREEVYVWTWILQEIVGYNFVDSILKKWETGSHGASEGTKLAHRFLEIRRLRLWGIKQEELPERVDHFLSLPKEEENEKK